MLSVIEWSESFGELQLSVMTISVSHFFFTVLERCLVQMPLLKALLHKINLVNCNMVVTLADYAKCISCKSWILSTTWCKSWILSTTNNTTQLSTVSVMTVQQVLLLNLVKIKNKTLLLFITTIVKQGTPVKLLSCESLYVLKKVQLVHNFEIMKLTRAEFLCKIVIRSVNSFVCEAAS